MLSISTSTALSLSLRLSSMGIFSSSVLEQTSLTANRVLSNTSLILFSLLLILGGRWQSLDPPVVAPNHIGEQQAGSRLPTITLFMGR